MFRIHVGLDLENEAGEFLFRRRHFAGVGFARHRRRRPCHQTVQHVIHAEVTECGTEEHRGQLAAQESLLIELVGSALHQLQLIAQLRRQIFTHRRIQLRVVRAFDDAHFLGMVWPLPV